MLEITSINAKFNGESISTVNARELHEWLESKQDFSTWIKKRIKQCQFVENIDFVLLHQKVEQVSGAKHRIDYLVSYDMAKHLSMLEFEKFSDLASQAGRTLNVVGKKLKPKALEKVESLKAQIQPDIFIN